MTVDGYNIKSGAVKAPATRNDKRNIPAGAVVCALIRGKPGGPCHKVLEGGSLRYHEQRMAKIDNMSGPNKPPKVACCSRHYYIDMVLKDDTTRCYGLPLRWNFAGDKCKKPWGRPVTKKDLLIDGGSQQAAVAPAPENCVRAGAGQPMRGRGQGEGAAAGEAGGDDGGKATVLLFSPSPPAATGSSPSTRDACASSRPDPPSAGRTR